MIDSGGMRRPKKKSFRHVLYSVIACDLRHLAYFDFIAESFDALNEPKCFERLVATGEIV